MKKCDVLYLVIPCYYEEVVLPETSKRLVKILIKIIQCLRVFAYQEIEDTKML